MIPHKIEDFTEHGMRELNYIRVRFPDGRGLSYEIRETFAKLLSDAGGIKTHNKGFVNSKEWGNTSTYDFYDPEQKKCVTGELTDLLTMRWCNQGFVLHLLVNPEYSDQEYSHGIIREIYDKIQEIYPPTPEREGFLDIVLKKLHNWKTLLNH